MANIDSAFRRGGNECFEANEHAFDDVKVGDVYQSSYDSKRGSVTWMVTDKYRLNFMGTVLNIVVLNSEDRLWEDGEVYRRLSSDFELAEVRVPLAMADKR